jgi:hypothetical protein
MHQYITDTSFAARGLIGLITEDAKSLDALRVARTSAIAKEKAFHQAFMQNENHPYANHWHGQFHDAAKARGDVDALIASLTAQIIDKEISVAVLAGALLQIGKQGISAVHGSTSKCKNTRTIRGVKLERVVWAGRNQALHYETPSDMNQSTERMFGALNAFDVNTPALDSKAKRNLAYDLVLLLGWLDYAIYESDMVSLIG